MFSSSSRSRSTMRSSYSNPPSRSQTPTRSRSGSLEPSFGSFFSKPMSRASSLQSLSATGSSFSSRQPVIGTSLNRYKSISLTGLSTPSSFSPTFSYKPQASFSTNRYSASTPTPFRSSLMDIRRPPTIDRYSSADRFQSVSRYSSVPSVVPASSRYQFQASPAPTPKFYAGANPYLTSYANQQGIGAYTKLLRYSFASGANRDRSTDFTPPVITSRYKERIDRSSDYVSERQAERASNFTPPAIATRNSYFDLGRNSYRASPNIGTSSYTNYGRTAGLDGVRTSYRSGISSNTDVDGPSDLYKTRYQPTGAMSKYWTTPRKLFV